MLSLLLSLKMTTHYLVTCDFDFPDIAVRVRLRHRRWLPDTVACVGEGATFKPACKFYSMVAMTTGSTKTPVPGRRCAHSSHFEKRDPGIFFGKPGNPQSFYLSATSDMRKRHRQGYYQLHV